MKVDKIEALRIIPVNFNPEVYYILPSGFSNVDIEVFESAYEQLEVNLVNKNKWRKEKRS